MPNKATENMQIVLIISIINKKKIIKNKTAENSVY